MVATAQSHDTGACGDAVADTFIDCLERAKHVTLPFDYWLLTNALPKADVEEVANLPLPKPDGAIFTGRRESNNKLRVFFSPENQAKYPVCKRVAAGFDSQRVRAMIERETGAKLDGTKLRIEYCQDAPGFWLEPHTDIKVKKFTMLVYLIDDPELVLAGTDIHEGPPDFKYVGTAPYGKNLGVIFIPGTNTWHGVGHHPIAKDRRSIIINFVAPDWRDTFELCNP